jgi:hypothetical protein
MPFYRAASNLTPTSPFWEAVLLGEHLVADVERKPVRAGCHVITHRRRCGRGDPAPLPSEECAMFHPAFGACTLKREK